MSNSSLIYVFSLAFEPYIGGAEIALREIAERMPGMRFRIYTSYALKRFPLLYPERITRKGNITIVRVGPRIRYLAQYLFPIFATIRAFRDAVLDHPRAVWGMLESYGGIAAYLFHLGKPSVPYLLTMQSGDSEEFWRMRIWFWKPLYKKIYTRAGRIQAISNFLAKRARSYGASPDIITVIPNGITIGAFDIDVSGEQRRQIRKKIGISERSFCVLTTSRLEYKNGVDVLIKGFAEWLRAHREYDAVLVIAGRGTLASSLIQLAEKEGITGQVKFLGEISNAALPEYYKAADVFTRLSRSEGLGISFLEAMASGVPMIGTCVGGIPEFLIDGETGLLVQPDDPQGFANALERFANDHVLREKVVMQAKMLVYERYSWDSIAGEMNKLFDSLVFMHTSTT